MDTISGLKEWDSDRSRGGSVSLPSPYSRRRLEVPRRFLRPWPNLIGVMGLFLLAAGLVGLALRILFYRHL